MITITSSTHIPDRALGFVRPYGVYFIYIARAHAGWPASPLANPYTGDSALARYRQWLRQQWRDRGPARAALLDLAARHTAGEHLELGCWCKPWPDHPNVPCHGDVILDSLAGILGLTPSELRPPVNRWFAVHHPKWLYRQLEKELASRHPENRSSAARARAILDGHSPTANALIDALHMIGLRYHHPTASPIIDATHPSLAPHASAMHGVRDHRPTRTTNAVRCTHD